MRNVINFFFTIYYYYYYYYYYSYMALQSNTDLRLLNGLLLVNSVSDLSFQFVILCFALINIWPYTIGVIKSRNGSGMCMG